MTQPRNKGVVVILDGLGDRPCRDLGGRTPLEYAETPYLDSLAKQNQCGLMDPMFPGLPVDTHTGVGILFGLTPYDAACLCRGPIEAAGIDLDLQYGDLLFRANLATVQKDGEFFRIIDRRAGRINNGVAELCDALSDIEVGDNIRASLFPATQHRCVLRFRGSNLSSGISDTDPGGMSISSGILRSIPIGIQDTNAINTADAVNNFTEISHKILASHTVNIERENRNDPPANGVVTRGVGTYQSYTNYLSYLNVNASVVAAESTILGLGKLFNFTTITDDSFTALPDTDIRKKLEYAKNSLVTHDLAFVHIKATDTTAHDRDPQAKADFIARFDNALKDSGLENFVVGICADHSTDSLRGEHNGDAVPVLLHNPEGRRDHVARFNELDCGTGALGRLSAQSFLTSILDAMGCLANFKVSEIDFYPINRQ